MVDKYQRIRNFTGSGIAGRDFTPTSAVDESCRMGLILWPGDSYMKPDIHPEYKRALIECACGNKIETYSTKGSYRVDICSACHPFFTGRQKLIDSAGRIERFKQKYANVPKSGGKKKKEKKKAE